MDRAAPAAHQPPYERAVPLRPLTLGELLDAAMQLVHRNGRTLLMVAAVLAALEQLVLYPIRLGEGYHPASGPPDLFSGYWTVFALGMGLEAMIITALGLVTGRAVVADVASVPARQLGRFRPGIIAKTALLALIAGVPALLGAFLGPVWLVGYPLFGLAAVVLYVERQGLFRTLGRASAVAFRGGLRVLGVRVLGYLAWALLRFGFFLGVVAGQDFLSLDNADYDWVLIPSFVLANTVAYACLAALDAALLIESRARVEGLDIWLNRAALRRPLSADLLAATR
ncbi:hypothetical protein [Catellatospora tritici]|uniref:hypothetical protein n=1 Tax=Catellatospora tritici TaxID=2851566 RepID=UPI001C2D65BC|nr:hypothetical protein [Catellatospora tritici]MBV1849477.1 hypothetical protein [Catellatospora tritici]MBV1854049.1 hypothetical protein [Catellatospora tritici]